MALNKEVSNESSETLNNQGQVLDISLIRAFKGLEIKDRDLVRRWINIVKRETLTREMVDTSEKMALKEIENRPNERPILGLEHNAKAKSWIMKCRKETTKNKMDSLLDKEIADEREIRLNEGAKHIMERLDSEERLLIKQIKERSLIKANLELEILTNRVTAETNIEKEYIKGMRESIDEGPLDYLHRSYLKSLEILDKDLGKQELEARTEEERILDERQKEERITEGKIVEDKITRETLARGKIVTERELDIDITRVSAELCKISSRINSDFRRSGIRRRRLKRIGK